MRRRLGRALSAAAAIVVAAAALSLIVNAVSGTGIALVAPHPQPGRVVSLARAYAAHVSDSATFIDARVRPEYAAGHIASALSVPLLERARELARLRRELPRTRPLIVYCDGGHCVSASDLSAWLVVQGWRNVSVLRDGYPVWQAAGFPVSTGTAP